MSLKKLQELGIIRLCKCGCGQTLRKKSNYISSGHYSTMYSRMLRGRKYKERGYGVHERPRKPRSLSQRDIDCRKHIFESAQKLYRYILGDNLDGGLRLWFDRNDVSWVLGKWARDSFAQSDKFLKIVRGLETIGLIETRRATEGSQGHKGNKSWLQYRLIKVDLEFLDESP